MFHMPVKCIWIGFLCICVCLNKLVGLLLPAFTMQGLCAFEQGTVWLYVFHLFIKPHLECCKITCSFIILHGQIGASKNELPATMTKEILGIPVVLRYSAPPICESDSRNLQREGSTSATPTPSALRHCYPRPCINVQGPISPFFPNASD